MGLRDVNVVEESGTLVGIMGGSGAGKSTLLNVLNGTEAPTSGAVTINGIDIHKDKVAVGQFGHGQNVVHQLAGEADGAGEQHHQCSHGNAQQQLDGHGRDPPGRGNGVDWIFSSKLSIA